MMQKVIREGVPEEDKRLIATVLEESSLLPDDIVIDVVSVNRRTKLASLAETIVGYDYDYPEMDGFTVGSKYTHYLLDGEEPEWSKLLDNNKDDVLALKAMVEQIQQIIQR